MKKSADASAGASAGAIIKRLSYMQKCTYLQCSSLGAGMRVPNKKIPTQRLAIIEKIAWCYADSNSVNHSVNGSLCSFAYWLSNSQSFPANQQTAAKYVSFFGT